MCPIPEFASVVVRFKLMFIQILTWLVDFPQRLIEILQLVYPLFYCMMSVKDVYKVFNSTIMYLYIQNAVLKL